VRTDTGGGPIAFADAAAPVVDASSPPPDDPPPPPPDGVAAFVNLEVCPSAPGVDKIIFNMAEPMAKLPDMSPIQVMPGGTTCTNAFNSSMTSGEYAYGSKCGSIDRSKPIVVIVGAGVTSASGKTLPPGTYTFQPTGMRGRVCGDVFRL